MATFWKQTYHFFINFWEKLLHSGVNKKLHNFFLSNRILVDFGYVKVDKITLRMVPILFISKFFPGPTLFWLYYNMILSIFLFLLFCALNTFAFGKFI